jgi:myo-inositol-1(or 4)-monophosphatase
MSETRHDEIPESELSEIYAFAIQLGKDSGKILLDSLHQRRRDGVDGEKQEIVEELVIEEKMNAVDIVTKTDNGMSGSEVGEQACGG